MADIANNGGNAGATLDLFGQPSIPAQTAQPAQATPAQAPQAQPQPQDDPMADLFDFGEAFAPEGGQPAPAQGQEPPAQGGNPPQTAQKPNADEQRYQYWQSQADRLKNELQLERQRAEQVNPILEALKARPDIIERLQREASGELPPERPTQPANYNEIEAYNNPDSDSWKYRKSLEDFTQKKLEHFEKKEQARLEAFQKQQMAQQRAMQAQMAVNQATQDIAQKYGWDAARTERFMKRWSSQQSLTVDYLAQVDNLIERAQAERRMQSSQQSQQRNVIPLPLGVRGTAQTASQRQTDEQEFNQSFFGPKQS